MSGSLSMWTVYDHPKDWPRYFVARRWEVNGEGIKPTGDVELDVDLNRIRRNMIQKGLTPLCRDPTDDPTIVETWL